MKIILRPDPLYERLFGPSVEVTPDYIRGTVAPLIPRFRHCMETAKPRAVGLCAPQVGIFERWFMTHLDGRRRFYANPIWAPVGPGVQRDIENCFSAPGFTVVVERHTRIVVEYLDVAGNRQGPRILEDYEARVFQHEADHLDGKTIFPRDWDRPGAPRPVTRMRLAVVDDPILRR